MGGRASGCGARTRSSWRIRTSRSWADRARHDRRHRDVQPSRRHAAPEGQGQALARRAHAPAVQPRRGVRAGRPGRVRGQGGPHHRRPDVPRRRAGRGARQAGRRSSIELDGVHTIHLGDIGHLLSEEKLADIGSVDIACVPLGGVAVAEPGRRARRPARSEDRRPDADLRRRGRLRGGAQAVLPRDGRRADHPAEAVGDRDQPPGRDDRPSCSSRAASRPDGAAGCAPPPGRCAWLPWTAGPRDPGPMLSGINSPTEPRGDGPGVSRPSPWQARMSSISMLGGIRGRRDRRSADDLPPPHDPHEVGVVDIWRRRSAPVIERGPDPPSPFRVRIDHGHGPAVEMTRKAGDPPTQAP